jgi:hypothetical protein
VSVAACPAVFGQVLPAGPAYARAPDGAALAKKLPKPIAGLISVPIQFDFDRGMRPDGGGEVFEQALGVASWSWQTVNAIEQP